MATAVTSTPAVPSAASMGIDGRIFPVSALENRRKAKADELQLGEVFPHPGEAKGQGEKEKGAPLETRSSRARHASGGFTRALFPAAESAEAWSFPRSRHAAR